MEKGPGFREKECLPNVTFRWGRTRARNLPSGAEARMTKKTGKGAVVVLKLFREYLEIRSHRYLCVLPFSHTYYDIWDTKLPTKQKIEESSTDRNVMTGRVGSSSKLTTERTSCGMRENSSDEESWSGSGIEYLSFGLKFAWKSFEKRRSLISSIVLFFLLSIDDSAETSFSSSVKGMVKENTVKMAPYVT
jgi:hypothetical protein